MSTPEVLISLVLGVAIAYGAYRYISGRKSKSSGGGFGGGNGGGNGGGGRPPTQPK
jgi:hypothetical protein